MNDKGSERKISAAAYIRMSGRQQDKSPAEQRAEIAKLAAAEGCHVADEHWFFDEAVTGDSTTDERSGLAALLAAAKARRFTVVLAWHTNRISREDPMDAIVFYNQLRKAGVDLHTCCEGPIDLEDFTRQLLLFVNQKGSNDFLTELSAKSVRGKIANAKLGGWNGGTAPYGMERGEFEPSGLYSTAGTEGQGPEGKPSGLAALADQRKLEAIRYAFQRFDMAHISKGKLARELQAKGYPAPSRKPWSVHHVDRLLKNPAYAGISRWGVNAWGKYYEARGEQLACSAENAKKGKQRKKPIEDAITVNSSIEGIIPVDLFQRVAKKLKQRVGKGRRGLSYSLPLSGLMFCALRQPHASPACKREEPPGGDALELSKVSMRSLQRIRAAQPDLRTSCLARRPGSGLACLEAQGNLPGPRPRCPS